MAVLKKPDNRLYLGKGGSGKSTLARYQLSTFKRVIIHDTAGEPESLDNAILTESKTDLIDRLLMAKAGPVRICWRGARVYGEADAFEFANEAAFKAGNIAILWEELDAYTTAGNLPKWAHKCVHWGRHEGLRTLSVARSPSMISRNLTRNVTRFMVFRSEEPRDLKYLADYLGTKAVNGIPGLKEYHCLDWTEVSCKVRKAPFR